MRYDLAVVLASRTVLALAALTLTACLSRPEFAGDDGGGYPTGFGPFGAARMLDLGLSTGEFGPSLSDNQLELYFCRSILGQFRMFVAKRSDRAQVFGDGIAFSGAPNGDVDPTISPSGLDLYYFNNRALQQAHRASLSSPWNIVGAADLAYGPFDFDGGVGSGGNAGTRLVAGSSSDPHAPESEIVERVNVDGIWSSAVSLGIHGTTADTGPTLSSDGLELLFARASPANANTFSTYRTVRSSVATPFPPPAPFNLGFAAIDDPELSSDGQDLYFSASDGGGASRIYVAHRDPL